MSHAHRHRAPRPVTARTPRSRPAESRPADPRPLGAVAAAVTAAPLALAALSLLAAPLAQAAVPGTVATGVTAAAPTSTYVVQPGDTLAGIARKLGVPGGWPAIWEANRATVPDPGRIHVGQRLVIPGGSGTAPAAPPASTPTPPAPPAPPPAQGRSGGTYVVRPGDTLAGIARTLGVPGGWPALWAANRATVPDPGRLSVGQRLVIPGGSGTTAPPPTTTPPSTTPPTTTPPTTSKPPTSTTPPASSTGTGDAIVAYARTFLGVPYVYGGMSRSGVDCSGLTSLVLRHEGFSPPRTSQGQYGWARAVSASQARPGDLVFGYFDGGGPGHVGIYVGNGMMIDAPVPGQVVGQHRVPFDARYGRPPGM